MAYLGFVPPGVVLPFAGATAPQGWILCNGAAVSRSTYAALFSAISTAHGSGDGSTTFNLPDYRARILRGVDTMGGLTAARDPDRASRTASNAGGNTGDNVGSVQGQATKTPASAFTTAAQTVTGTISGSSHTIPNNGPATPYGFAAYATVNSVNNNASGAEGIVTSINHSHGHSLTAPASTVNGGGDNETRPINAYVNYIIKI